MSVHVTECWERYQVVHGRRATREWIVTGTDTRALAITSVGLHDGVEHRDFPQLFIGSTREPHHGGDVEVKFITAMQCRVIARYRAKPFHGCEFIASGASHLSQGQRSWT